MYRSVWLCVRDEKKEVNQFPDLKAFEKSACEWVSSAHNSVLCPQAQKSG